jgi:phosphoribosylaminoimidazole-succinocarboxamide synthase
MLYQTNLKDIKLVRRGKVRDVYDLGENLLIIATDRISCFDYVLPTSIPDKGKILTKLSLFWFGFLKGIDNHLVSIHVEDLPLQLREPQLDLQGRFMIVQKCEVVPFECVVRGYISGSGWKDYQKTGAICGNKLPTGLKESDKLPEPIFTPSTKADVGHDENIDFKYMQNKIGDELANKLKNLSLDIYNRASDYALTKGVILADTKFEFGLHEGKVILIDEVLTPDSSRFWPKNQYKPGGAQPSFDKQFVRDYLEDIKWNKQPPVPNLPEDIVKKTKAKYEEALKILKG